MSELEGRWKKKADLLCDLSSALEGWVGGVKDSHTAAIFVQKSDHVAHNVLQTHVANLFGSLVRGIEPHRIRYGAVLLSSVIRHAVDTHRHSVKELEIAAQAAGDVSLAPSCM